VESRRDYYEVLGVARDADGRSLKVRYRELAMQFHPDKNPGDKVAEERFKEVAEAYAVLSDEEKRRVYDQVGFEGEAPVFDGFGQGGVSEFFDNFITEFLGGKKRGRTEGRDLRYTLELTFDEAAMGCEKMIEFPSATLCHSCKGTGARLGVSFRPCPACAGRGAVRIAQGRSYVEKGCGTCGGDGKIVSDPCPSCTGTGLVPRQREFQVRIPAGAEDGTVRLVRNEGEPGRRGGKQGDLHVVLRVMPHPLFVREGADLLCEVPVPMTDATLGCNLEVPTVDGPVRMRIPAGTQTGKVFRLKGRGLPDQHGGRGDQRVRVVVEIPTSLPDRHLEMLEAFRQETGEEFYPKLLEFKKKLRDLERQGR
jgi:molecular chaperone DnaJ